MDRERQTFERKTGGSGRSIHGDILTQSIQILRGEPRIALGFQHREPPVPRPQWATTQMANDTSPCRHRFVDSHCGLSACWSGCVSSPGTQYKTKASTAFPSRATFSPTYCPSSRARQLQPYKLPIVTCTAASVVQTSHRHVQGL